MHGVWTLAAVKWFPAPPNPMLKRLAEEGARRATDVASPLQAVVGRPLRGRLLNFLWRRLNCQAGTHPLTVEHPHGVIPLQNSSEICSGVAFRRFEAWIRTVLQKHCHDVS